MSKPDRREILSRVAAGAITPEEAASQLNSISASEAQAEPGIRKIRVLRRLGTLEVVGDATVRDAVAEGPHRARLDGDVMVFESETADEWGGFFFGLGRNAGNEKLLIRCNPSMGLDLELQAGSCRVRGVEGPIRADVQAASAVIEGFRDGLNLTVQAGSVRASGQLKDGDSRIGCDAGSVNLHLEPGSSVRVKARASMGRVELPGAVAIRGAQEVTVGKGEGSLLIDTNMGSVRVTADS
jgi:hypothetical protein